MGLQTLFRRVLSKIPGPPFKQCATFQLNVIIRFTCRFYQNGLLRIIAYTVLLKTVLPSDEGNCLVITATCDLWLCYTVIEI